MLSSDLRTVTPPDAGGFFSLGRIETGALKRCLRAQLKHMQSPADRAMPLWGGNDQITNYLSDSGAPDLRRRGTPGCGGNQEPMLWNVRNLFSELFGNLCAIASPVPSRDMRS